MVLISDDNEMEIVVNLSRNSYICCGTSYNCFLAIGVLGSLEFDYL